MTANEFLLVLRIVATGLLYLFLGVALYVIWRSFSAPASKNASKPEAATLHFDDESDRQFSVRPVTALGRAKDNDVVLDDPFISSNHAIIVWRDGGWWIEDLGSHNGTFINDTLALEATELSHGDRIALGRTNLRFTLERPETKGKSNGSAPQE